MSAPKFVESEHAAPSAHTSRSTTCATRPSVCCPRLRASCARSPSARAHARTTFKLRNGSCLRLRTLRETASTGSARLRPAPDGACDHGLPTAMRWASHLQQRGRGAPLGIARVPTRRGQAAHANATRCARACPRARGGAVSGGDCVSASSLFAVVARQRPTQSTSARTTTSDLRATPCCTAKCSRSGNGSGPIVARSSS